MRNGDAARDSPFRAIAKKTIKRRLHFVKQADTERKRRHGTCADLRQILEFWIFSQMIWFYERKFIGIKQTGLAFSWPHLNFIWKFGNSECNDVFISIWRRRDGCRQKGRSFMLLGNHPTGSVLNNYYVEFLPR